MEMERYSRLERSHVGNQDENSYDVLNEDGFRYRTTAESCNGGKESLHGTVPKSPITYDGTNLKTLHSAQDKTGFVSNRGGPGLFVDAMTLMTSTDAQQGAYVMESYAYPKERFLENIHVQNIPSIYNLGTSEDREDMAKFIVTELVPSLLKETSKGFRKLVSVTKCENRSIRGKLFDHLYKLMYSTEVRRWEEEDIIESVGEMVGMVSRHLADHGFLHQIVHMVILSLAALYYRNLELGCEFSTVERINVMCSEVLSSVTDTEVKRFDSVSGGLLKAMKQISSSLHTKMKKRSNLRFVDWRDTLLTENNRQKILSDIGSFSEIEILTFIFGISNQVLQRHQAGNNDLLKYLLKVTETAVKILSKRKQQILLPICELLTKTVSYVICDSDVADQGTDGSRCPYKQTLLDILSVFLDSQHLTISERRYLLKRVEKLLFNKDKFVVVHMLYLFRRNAFESQTFREMVLPHIESIVGGMNLRLEYTETAGVDVHVPLWREFYGQVGFDCDVKAFVLFPTKSCLSEGCMSDYKRKADTNLTKRHTNNLKMLHRLNQSPSHENICGLIAYQTRPLPFFYITERFREDDLSMYLMRMRQGKTWLTNQRLIILASEIIQTVKFLHSKGIVHRDLTASRFALKSNGSPVLCDFGIALHMDGSMPYATDTRENLIPLRWSSPESILSDRFETKSDVYMVGMLLYEIFTHGNHPFTELYNMPLESVLEKVVFQDLKPRCLPCIPKQVHDLIIMFTSCEDSTGASNYLQKGLEKMEEYLAQMKEKVQLVDSHESDKRYPPRGSNQGEPERELPLLLKHFKTSGSNPRQSYFNLRKSQIRTRTVIATTEADLLSPDDPVLSENSRYLTVRESVENTFREVVLPILHQEGTAGDLGTIGRPEVEILPNSKPTLKYKIERGVNMLDLASRGAYGDPYNDESKKKYLEVVYKLVDFVCQMHRRNFILRDVCGKVIYLTHDGRGQAATTRIGRMVHLRTGEILDDCVIGHRFGERLHWIPIEVLDDELYSFEGDMYMVAMTIHEFYGTLDVFRHNPSANKLKCIPFPLVPKNQLREHILSGEVPEQADACPPWLYDLMRKCWDRDRTRRPSAEKMKQHIAEKLRNFEEKSDDSGEDNRLNRQHSTDSSTDNYPETDYSIDTHSTDMSSDVETNDVGREAIAHPPVVFRRMVKKSGMPFPHNFHDTFKNTKTNPMFGVSDGFDSDNSLRKRGRSKLSYQKSKSDDVRPPLPLRKPTDDLASHLPRNKGGNSNRNGLVHNVHIGFQGKHKLNDFEEPTDAMGSRTSSFNGNNDYSENETSCFESDSSTIVFENETSEEETYQSYIQKRTLKDMDLSASKSSQVKRDVTTSCKQKLKNKFKTRSVYSTTADNSDESNSSISFANFSTGEDDNEPAMNGEFVKSTNGPSADDNYLDPVHM